MANLGHQPPFPPLILFFSICNFDASLCKLDWESENESNPESESGCYPENASERGQKVKSKSDFGSCGC